MIRILIKCTFYFWNGILRKVCFTIDYEGMSSHIMAINYGLGDLFENIRAGHEEIEKALKHLDGLGYVVLKSNNHVVYLGTKGYEYYKEER